MSTRRYLKLVRPHERQRLRRWLVWCLLIAAAANVPFAVSRVELVNAMTPASSKARNDDDIPARWPAETPHVKPWPAPTFWTEWKGFGKWLFAVSAPSSDPNDSGFSMTVRWSGWPLPVLEQQIMWWDWDSPALKDATGRKSDPPMSLMPLGLILNPIIVSSGTWVLMVAMFFLTVIRRRAKRIRRGLCVRCGYDLAGLQVDSECDSVVCPECGSSRDEMDGAMP